MQSEQVTKKKAAPPVPKFGLSNPQDKIPHNEQINMEIENFFAEIGQTNKPTPPLTQTLQSTASPLNQQKMIEEKQKDQKKELQKESKDLKDLKEERESRESKEYKDQKKPQTPTTKLNPQSQIPSKEIKDLSKINDKLSNILKKKELQNAGKQPTSITSPSNKVQTPNNAPSVFKLTPLANKLEEYFSKIFQFNRYDPARPNDYEELKALEQEAEKEAAPIKEYKDWKDLKPKQKREKESKQGNFSNLVEEEEHNVQLTTAEEKALKMMEKQGFKIGEGLGKNLQGMRTPLIAKKKSDMTGVIQASSVDMVHLIPQQVLLKKKFETHKLSPTRILLLLNLVTPQQVDDDLEGEIVEELNKYGMVKKCIIYMIPNLEEDLAVRVFVEFEKQSEAMQAFLAVDGRVFEKRIVACRFYSEESFAQNIYDDEIK